SPKHDAPLPRNREVDVAGRPAEPERRRADPEADRAVGAIGPTVRVRSRDELAGQHQALLGEVEVEDAVPGCRVVRLLEAVGPRELAADLGLTRDVLPTREHE